MFQSKIPATSFGKFANMLQGIMDHVLRDKCIKEGYIHTNLFLTSDKSAMANVAAYLKITY
jgi:hypothetical protein